MLQMQYYTNKLTSNQIERVLSNYKIKYTTLKTELDVKINGMIQIFLKDILAFLENIQQIAAEREKIQEYDRIKNEIQTLTDKLNEKTKKEIELKNEINNLSHENRLLKEKINVNLKFSRNNSHTSENNNSVTKNPKKKEKSKSIIKNQVSSYQEIGFSYSSKYKTSKASAQKDKINITTKKKEKVGSHIHTKRKSFDKNAVDDFVSQTASNNDNREFLLTSNEVLSTKLKHNKHINYSFEKKSIPLELSHVSTYSNNKKELNISQETPSQDKEVEDLLSLYEDMLKDEIEMLDTEEKNLKQLIEEN